MPNLNTTVLSAGMQAVVVIHGMGEQIPMDTIKDFVNAVWQNDDVITANGLPNPTEVWTKPDARTGSLELRRITTRESIASPDFPRGVRSHSPFSHRSMRPVRPFQSWRSCPIYVPPYPINDRTLDAIQSWPFGKWTAANGRYLGAHRFAH